MLWSAFILGLFGSLHCLGMCGPIALALPLDRSSQWKAGSGALVYNLGRTLTYALMGLVFGQIGQALSLIGLQRWVSILAGTVLLLGVILHYVLQRPGLSLPGLQRIVGRVKSGLAQRLGRTSYRSLLSIGLLNGLLPCGLVYFTLIGAIGMGAALQGAAYMALFGLGTVPLMLATNLLGHRIGQRWRSRLTQAIPYVLALFGVLFILRGMALGIPFISPDFDGTEAVRSCCH